MASQQNRNKVAALQLLQVLRAWCGRFVNEETIFSKMVV